MSSETKTSLPSWLTDPTKDALTGIQDWLGSDNNYVYGMKKGENLFTPMNGMQNKAIGNVDWLAGQDLGKMFGLDDARSGWNQYMGADLVDGKIGQTSDYMNPYIKGVLKPQIRELNQQSQRNANDIGASAASAGAFGDARHGIAEGENFEKTNQAISDATGAAYSNAFDRAAAERQAAIERMGTGAQGLMGVGDNLFQKFNSVNDSLYNAGTQAYNMDERQRMTQQQFQEALKNKDYDSMIKLLAAVNGSPKESTSTTSSNDGMFGIIGSLLGGLFK
jgi:hypothetical protein